MQSLTRLHIENHSQLTLNGGVITTGKPIRGIIMTKQVAATFEWNEATVTKATELYEALIANVGVSEANKNDSLGTIAKEIGAKSAQAVRSKLAAAKVYQKAAAPRKVGGTVKTAKVHFVRALQKVAIDNGIELNPRKFESLESGVGADLQDLIKLVEALSGDKVVVNPDAETAQAPKQETAKA